MQTEIPDKNEEAEESILLQWDGVTENKDLRSTCGFFFVNWINCIRMSKNMFLFSVENVRDHLAVQSSTEMYGQISDITCYHICSF